MLQLTSSLDSAAGCAKLRPGILLKGPTSISRACWIWQTPQTASSCPKSTHFFLPHVNDDVPHSWDTEGCLTKHSISLATQPRRCYQTFSSEHMFYQMHVLPVSDRVWADAWWGSSLSNFPRKTPCMQQLINERPKGSIKRRLLYDRQTLPNRKNS